MNMCRIYNLSLIILLSGCKEASTDNHSVAAADNPFDKVKLTDLNNNPVSLTQYKGKTVFLNLWATWCKPCIAEMPSIEKARSILQNESIVFLLASGESTEEISAFKNSHNYQFNYARINNSEELDMQGLPTTFIFDSNGQLIFSETGSRKWDDSINISIVHKIVRKND